MQTKPLEQWNDNYLQNSLGAYLDGGRRCSLRWVMGAVRASSSSAHARMILETRFASYASTPQYKELMAQLA